MSRNEAIERARPIAAVAERNALSAERLRKLPAENIAAIIDSGLMPLLRPAMFGGYANDWITLVDCVAEVAEVCGATGWCLSFLLQHQFYLGYFPIAAQREVYETHPNPKILTSFAPTGTVRPVSGGYELAGIWTYASASDHCDWAILGGRTVDEDGNPLILNFLLSRDQFQVVDTWDSMGLRGSGSNDVVVTGALVPAIRCYRQIDALSGDPPEADGDAGGPRPPLRANAGFGVMAPLHGLARGIYKSFVADARSRTGANGAKPQEGPSELYDAIGHARGEIELAYLLTEKMSATSSNGSSSREDAVRVRRDMLLVRTLLAGAANRLFGLAGARSLGAAQPMQRLWRDFHAISHHVSFSQPSLQTAGRSELGLPAAPGDIHFID